jgi:type II secretion system protein G
LPNVISSSIANIKIDGIVSFRKRLHYVSIYVHMERKAKQKEKGFTLIELLIVIAIIGLLASIVMVSLSSARSKARDSQRRANLKQLQAALELYYNVNGGYPITTGGTFWGETTAYGSHPLTGASAYIPNLSPTYVAVLPHDPLTNSAQGGFGGCYVGAGEANYLYVSNGRDYKLLVHCLMEKIQGNDPMVDPTRDGGSDGCAVDGTTSTIPWAIGVYTPGALCW